MEKTLRITKEPLIMSGCVLNFVEKSFTDCPKTTKLVKAFFLESVPLYGTYVRKARQVQQTRLCDRSKVYLRELYEERVLEFFFFSNDW